MRGTSAAGHGIRHPDRDCDAEDEPARDRPEVPTIKAVRDIGIHQEDVAGGDSPTALPDRHGSPLAVGPKGPTDDRAVDGDREIKSADNLPGKGRYLLQERQTIGQISAPRQEVGQRLRRCHDNQIAEPQVGRRTQPIEPDRDRRARVPDQFCRQIDDPRQSDQGDRSRRQNGE